MNKVMKTDRADTKYRVGGVLHRPDGPAWIWGDGKESWWLFGDWHRYYGSPGIGTDWYIHGRKISK